MIWLVALLNLAGSCMVILGVRSNRRTAELLREQQRLLQALGRLP